MQTVTVILRRVKKTGAVELFFANSHEDKQTWWIDGYAEGDGHFQATRDYLRRETEPVPKPTPENLAMVNRWANSPNPVRAVIGSRLAGPRGAYYAGD